MFKLQVLGYQFSRVIFSDAYGQDDRFQTTITNSATYEGGCPIYVTGEGSTNVIEKIQSKTKLNVLYEQHTGRVTFEERARKKQDKMLVQMANDKNVDVNIEAVMNTEVIPGSNGQEKFSGGESSPQVVAFKIRDFH